MPYAPPLRNADQLFSFPPASARAAVSAASGGLLADMTPHRTHHSPSLMESSMPRVRAPVRPTTVSRFPSQQPPCLWFRGRDLTGAPSCHPHGTPHSIGEPISVVIPPGLRCAACSNVIAARTLHGHPRPCDSMASAMHCIPRLGCQRSLESHVGLAPHFRPVACKRATCAAPCPAFMPISAGEATELQAPKAVGS